MYTLLSLFLMLSTALTQVLPDNKGDCFDFSTLPSREGQAPIDPSSESTYGIPLVGVKDEGNQADVDTGLGTVIQSYSIGQTEVTAEQYCTYLNAVATGNNYPLFYNEKMGTDPNVASIRRDVSGGLNRYNVIRDEQGDRGNFPIVYVTLYQAARFCNWLQNRDNPDVVGDALTEHGAYTLNGVSSGPIARNSRATWFLPTEDEWYKAAYYKGGGLREEYWQFPNRSNWAPSHLLESENVNGANYSSATKKSAPCLTPVTYFQQSVGAYNSYDMGGNVAEWTATEEEQGTIPLKYIARGGSWRSSYYSGDWYGIALSKWVRPAYRSEQGYDNIGFRVATSLNVASAPPATKAPGEGELSPKETLEAPFVAVVGLAAVLGGKKMYDGHNSAEVQQRGQEQQEINRERENTEDTPHEERVDEREVLLVHHNGSSLSSHLTQTDSSDIRYNTPISGQIIKQRLIESTPSTPVKSNLTEMHQVAEWWSEKLSHQKTSKYELPEQCRIIYEKIVNKSSPSSHLTQPDSLDIRHNTPISDHITYDFLDTRYHTPLSGQIIDFRDKQRFASQTDPREKSKGWWTIHDASRTDWQQRAVRERLKEQSVTKGDIEEDISLDHIGAYYPDETSDDSYMRKEIVKLFGDDQSYNGQKQPAALIESSPENLSYSGYKSQWEAIPESNNPLAGSGRNVELVFPMVNIE